MTLHTLTELLAQRKSSNKVWTGKQASKSKLSKLDTGVIGEKLAKKALSRRFGKGFEALNIEKANAATDVGNGAMVIEIKTGLASNNKSAQHWRSTIGEPGKGERGLLKGMSDGAKDDHNRRKDKKILDRKRNLLRRLSSSNRRTKGYTVGIILSPGGSRGDVFLIPGFHLRLGWNKYATDEYYIGTYKV